jgi:hypothetical protein
MGDEEGGFADDDGGDGDDDASAMEFGSKDGVVFITGMEKDDDQAADPVLELLLLPHILDLPAFKARAAGAVTLDEEIADELTGRRNPLQLRHTY